MAFDGTTAQLQVATGVSFTKVLDQSRDIAYDCLGSWSDLIQDTGAASPRRLFKANAGDVADSTYVVTEDHAAAFTKVFIFILSSASLERRRKCSF